jgi:hypothetical protein
VKAEVRLRFRNVNKDRMVVTRKLQVTETMSKLSMKTLEGTLSFADDQGDSSKVSRLQISTSRAHNFKATDHLDSDGGAGRRASNAARGLASHSRQCHLLPSRGFQLDPL